MSSLQWIFIAIVCGAIEIFTTSFWFLWLALAGFLVAIGVRVDLIPRLESQLLVFALLTLIFIIFTRPLVMKFFKSNDTPSNVKALIGQQGIALTSISLLEYGQVKVNGEVWTAISQEGITAGQRILVTDIDGVKLRVESSVN